MFRPTTCQKLYQVRLLSTKAFNANEAAAKLHLDLKTPDILQRALTHRSYLHGKEGSNDRLQLLGSQVIRLNVFSASAKTLGLNASSIEIKEQASKYLDQVYLATRFDTLGLNDGLRFTAPEGHGVSRVKAKAFESVVGAVCHDQGMKAAEDFVQAHLYE
ncbi:ribonuclease III [Hesseltinella vesiculosa]|uniref:Ribonuclease III n=1 Tax=Hesseltinella vesiculosa TaxID=101127 RepID=A0A1X2GHK5_9FUNG|nr:ribonuclease III [Hesseltinella vesiculosa]